MNPVNTLKIHQYSIQILYRLGPKIFIADWLPCHNYKENKDEAIQGMDIKVDKEQMMTSVPECMSICQIQEATVQDEHLQWLKLARHKRSTALRHQTILVIQGWPGGNGWCDHERKAHDYPRSIKTAGSGPTPCQSHGHWKKQNY